MPIVHELERLRYSHAETLFDTVSARLRRTPRRYSPCFLPPDWRGQSFGGAGWLGVVLFFVISGFIMVYISGPEPFAAVNFLKRRAIRIVPLYWLFTGLAALLAAVMPSLFQTTVFTWSHFLQSLFFIVHEAPGRGDTSPLLSLGWTLNYEAYFYVVFAVLACLHAASRIVILTAWFVAAWLLGLMVEPQNPVVAFYLNVSPLAFAAGAWIGWSHLNGKAVATGKIPAFGLLTAVGLLLALADDAGPIMVQIGFAGQILWAFGMVRLGLILETRLRRSPLLEQLGDASYALYLSHMFAIGAVVYLARKLPGGDGTAMMLLVVIASVTVASVGSVIIHQTVERPLLRLLNRQKRPIVDSPVPSSP